MYLQRDTHNRPMQVNADRGGDTDVFMYTYLNGKYQNLPGYNRNIWGENKIQGNKSLVLKKQIIYI